MSWTTIPPWLYQNDLSDEALQERYVEAAERKWADCVADRQGLEQEIRDLRATERREVTAERWSALVDELGERYGWLEEAYQAEERAAAFLADARRALARYRPRKPLRDA
jgi:hypothetical protein